MSKNPNAPKLSHFAIFDPKTSGTQSNSFHPSVGITVTQRDGLGRPLAGTIRVLSDNTGNQISIIGQFNGWGKGMKSEDHLFPIPGTPYYEGKIRELYDGMQYRLLLNGEPVLDPSSAQFVTSEMIERFHPGEMPFLNSVFSDTQNLQSPASHPIDFHGRPLLISENSIYELAAKWEHRGQVGPPSTAHTYRFIAESGIPKAMADRGYTHIEFLPFTSSVDGKSWKFRYQSFGLFGPDSRYGTPEEFREMIAAFQKLGVGVIMDAVLGHYPFRANSGVRALETIGIHRFINGFGKPVFGGKTTIWGTLRYDFENPFVRRFLIDSVLTLFHDYGLSGIRIDNVDGIRAEPSGSLFLQELNRELSQSVPEAVIIGEMFDNQSSALQSALHEGLGFHAANDVDFFYNFVQKYLQAWDFEIDARKLGWLLGDSWQWERVPLERWITNHDEAANRQPGASGDYVATLLSGGSWDFVEAKTKLWGTLGMLAGSVYLDMLQIRFLQEGNFNNNPAVDWSLLQHPSQSKVDNYFSALSQLYKNGREFSPVNLHPNIVNHTDNENKVISIQRIDFTSGSRIYAVFNFSSKVFTNYRIGVDSQSPLSIQLNSDDLYWGGKGLLHLKALPPQSVPFHSKDRSIEIPVLAPMSALVIRD